jgi:hypothetical protein
VEGWGRFYPIPSAAPIVSVVARLLRSFPPLIGRSTVAGSYSLPVQVGLFQKGSVTQDLKYNSVIIVNFLSTSKDLSTRNHHHFPPRALSSILLEYLLLLIDPMLRQALPLLHPQKPYPLDKLDELIKLIFRVF